MKAIITADVINSTALPSERLNADLREILKTFGKEKKHWEIYRGDEFQIRNENAQDAFETVIFIKTCLIAKGLDARFSIGIGDITYEAPSVKESNGEAFIFSGKTLDILKEQKSQSIMVKTASQDFDDTMNLIFQYLETIAQNWTESSANFIHQQMKFRDKNQTEIAALLSVTQGAYSRGLKRANYDLIVETDRFFRKKTAELTL